VPMGLLLPRKWRAAGQDLNLSLLFGRSPGERKLHLFMNCSTLRDDGEFYTPKVFSAGVSGFFDAASLPARTASASHRGVNMNTREEGPDPCDSEAWRRVIGSQQLPTIRGQSLIAAVQQIGSKGDRRVLEPLMKEISDRMMRILRKHIGRNHRNEGWDMIEEAHGKLIEAVLKPKSADGSALRTAFVTTVRLRGADAIRREALHKERYAYSEDEAVVPFGQKEFLSEDEERAHVEAALRRVKDPRKRLAFRLHMDGVPRYSIKVESIASALGVSDKTAETWIKETEEELKTILGVKP